ncbi:hypothetical protein F2P56_034822 [Juglans regia]|uniref:Uncharacterized protein LOC109000739 n=2 Tax=Juglans regia TaxID=51240 RepID=A0A2I4FNM7_JUGRE|nr:uncharacterized protein LOC109000739 [Juglans regia]KAF5445799.1 hypothetical protein F2P56_034822 [Juglans regia]
MQRRKRLLGESSRAFLEDEGWKGIWRLKVPGVTKIFIWKALNNCLPTRRNLFKRKILENSCCPICNQYEETICHVLWSCAAAVDVWAERRSPVQKWPSAEVDFGSVWRKMSQSLSMEELDLSAIVLRNIWLRRNMFIFESCFNSPASIFQQAEMTRIEYMTANNTECPGRNIVERREVRWKKPREGVTKINWDAAFLKSSKRMGIGIVFRDQEGDILLSACIPLSSVMTAAQAEANALWKALKMCEELRIGEAELEGDALSIVNAINNREENWEWGGQTIEDIRGLLHNRPQWHVTHTFREANKVADFLAKFSLNVNEEVIWMEDGPEGLYSLVLQDKVVTDS